MSNIIDLTFAVQIVIVIGGLLASLWISPLFLIFVGVGLFQMGLFYRAVEQYEQAED